VDQDENALIALKQLLGEADYDTTTRSRLKSLPVLWQGTFDVVLLADKLDMSGEEVVRQVRSRRTGYAGRSDAERAAF
jgi:DNA-binding response OmpR family regulator